MADRRPAGCGELCSHPLPRGAWNESRDTQAPAGGPVSPQTPVGPERARQAAGLLVLSLPEREEPQSLACISSAGGAGGRPAPAPGRVCSGCQARRCCQAAQVTAHTGRPRPPGSPTAGSTARPAGLCRGRLDSARGDDHSYSSASGNEPLALGSPQILCVSLQRESPQSLVVQIPRGAR